MTNEPTPNDSNEESWTAVEGAANPSEAALIAGFLQNQDIPARVVDRSFHQTPTTDDDLSPIAVAVPSARLLEAQQALAKREKEFASEPEGSDSVITDDGPARIDPDEKE
jgi:hypothetical protein